MCFLLINYFRVQELYQQLLGAGAFSSLAKLWMVHCSMSLFWVIFWFLLVEEKEFEVFLLYKHDFSPYHHSLIHQNGSLMFQTWMGQNLLKQLSLTKCWCGFCLFVCFCNLNFKAWRSLKKSKEIHCDGLGLLFVFNWFYCSICHFHTETKQLCSYVENVDK